MNLLEEMEGSILKIITALVNKICLRGGWPKDFLEVRTIILPKENKENKFSDQSLISQSAKVVAHILSQRLENKI